MNKQSERPIMYSFIQQLWQKLHSPSPLLTEPQHCCRQGPQLKIFSNSDSLAFRGGQCDMGLANKRQAEGAGWGFPERFLKGKTQLACISLIFCPLLIPLPFQNVTQCPEGEQPSCEGRQSHMSRAEKPMNRSLRYTDTWEMWRKPQGCVQTSYFEIRNTPYLVSTSVKLLFQTTNSLPGFGNVSQALLSVRHQLPNKTTLSNFYLQDWFTEVLYLKIFIVWTQQLRIELYLLHVLHCGEGKQEYRIRTLPSWNLPSNQK